jgi:putative FmdB family regulatory protein
MPVYTYRCDSCGVQFERHQSFSDAPLKNCPECRKRSLRKVISPVRVVFKGSGFYSTDHRPSSASTAPPSKGDSKTAPKAPDSSKDTSST